VQNHHGNRRATPGRGASLNTVGPPPQHSASELAQHSTRERRGLVALLMEGAGVVVGEFVGLGAGAETTDGAGVAGARAEEQPKDDVQDAEGEVHDSSGEDEGVPWPTDLIRLDLVVVQLAEHVTPDHDQGKAQPADALVGAEGRPVVLEELVAPGELADKKEGSDHGHENQRGGVEDEEGLGHVDLDGEGPGGGHDGGEADESANAQDVEDNHVNTFGLEALEEKEPHLDG